MNNQQSLISKLNGKINTLGNYGMGACTNRYGIPVAYGPENGQNMFYCQKGTDWMATKRYNKIMGFVHEIFANQEKETRKLKLELEEKSKLAQQLQATQLEDKQKIQKLEEEVAKLKVETVNDNESIRTLKKKVTKATEEIFLLEEENKNLKIQLRAAEFQLMHRDDDSSAPPSNFPSEVETDSSEESEDIEGDLRILAESLKINNQNKK